MPGWSRERAARWAAQVVVGVPVAVDVADEAFRPPQHVQVLVRAVVDEHEPAEVEAVDEVVGDRRRRPCLPAARRR